MFRVEVTSADGHKCGVPVQVDDHPGEPRPYVINQIADSFLIRRTEVHAVLERGTPAELNDHLRGYTKDELKPLHLRRGQTKPRAFWGEA